MRRSLLPFVLSLAVVTAACASASGPAVDDPSGASTTTTVVDDPSSTDTANGGQGQAPDTTDTTQDTRPLPEGEPARDFTLALGVDQTEQFVLSQEMKPVFMVFWAEW